MEDPFWKNKHFSYFCNHDCEYFPCHDGADPENFNCLFCYCPLYALGDRCGGTFVYLDNGCKDCSNCLFPHNRDNYGTITGRYKEILEAMRQSEGGISKAVGQPKEKIPKAAEQPEEKISEAVDQLDEEIGMR